MTANLCRRARQNAGFFRTIMLAGLLLILETFPVYSEIVGCVSNLDTVNWESTEGGDVSLCISSTLPWTATLLRDQVEIDGLTDGGALTIFLYSSTAIRAEGKEEARIEMVNTATHVWTITGTKFEHLNGGPTMQYLVWSPYPVNAPPWEDPTDWGVDEVKVFRCFEGEYTRCTTYYPIRECFDKLGNLSTRNFIVVSVDSGTDASATLNAFAPVDKQVSKISRNLRAYICEGAK